MGFDPTWLRQVSPPASQNHFNHCLWWDCCYSEEERRTEGQCRDDDVDAADHDEPTTTRTTATTASERALVIECWWRESTQHGTRGSNSLRRVVQIWNRCCDCSVSQQRRW